MVGDRTGMFADAVVAAVRAAEIVGRALSSMARTASSVVTPLGWSLLAVAVAGFAVGYRFGWVELVVAAFASVVILLIALGSLVARGSLAAELRIGHERLVVGQPGSGHLEVRNPSRRRTFGSRVELPMGRSVLDIALPALAGRATYSHEFPIDTGGRGVVDIGPLRSVLSDPIGVVRREIGWSGTTRVFVHPQTVTLPNTSTGFIRDLDGAASTVLTSSDVSFHALREYVPGDERRNIHWKSTAKAGTPMVRQFEESRRSRLVVALSLAASDYADDAEFELAVSAAGSLGIMALRSERDLAVVVGRSTPPFAGRKLLDVRHLDSLSRGRLLDELTAVDRDESSLPVGDVARVVADRVGDVSVAYLVCGSAPSARELRTASAYFLAGVEVVAVVCDAESAPGLRRIDGLGVLTIGYLDDLRRSLVRLAGR